MNANKKKKVVAVIPARMAASRFPGKPLQPILGLPMIEHVRRRALLCDVLDEVVVATCDQKILDTVKQHHGRAVMTSDQHLRCTDRVEEAMGHLQADIVVILQGDEPLFEGDILRKLVTPLLNDDKILCTNLLSTITDPQDLQDQDIIKTVLDQQGFVMYFSRAAIPFFRVKGGKGMPVYRQTGLSAFRKDFLHKFSGLQPTPLEITESIDFLRILEHRYSVFGVVSDVRTVGVDRPDDIGIIEKILREDPKQSDLYNQILNIR